MTEAKFAAKAHHSYCKAKPDELDLAPGDVVQVTNDDHASWWVGFNESSKESGWFPSNFVTRTAEAKPKSKPRRQVIITKRYEAADEDELTLEVGDVVKVKDDVDGWYLGRFNSVTGRFPSSHAEDYTPAESGARPLPQPPVQAPPTLPARSPALPQRVQADAGPTEALLPLSDDDADGARKEKKAGRRISRIFGAKKSRAKDGTPDAEPMSPADTAAHDEPMLPPRRPSVSSGSEPPAPAMPPPALPPIVATAEEEEAADSSAVAEETQPEAAPATGDEPQPSTDADDAAKPRGPSNLAKVLEDYEAESPEELNLMEGDVVTIISRGSDDDPRWKGEYHGKKGYFPGSVVEPIEQAAAQDDDEGDGDGPPRGGFKLAAYGVQKGGLGSIFAGAAGGRAALRKSAPRKADEPEEAAEAPALAAVPAMPRLRSVHRPAPKEPPKEEEPPNFLAHLAKVPRRPTPAAASDDAEAEAEAEVPAQAEDVADEGAADADAGADAVAPASPPPESAEPDADEAAADTADEEAAEEAPRAPYDPVKAPSLPQVKRLVRRGQRQMPTAEGLKKSTTESQSQSLQSALERDKDLEPAKPSPPPVAEKPKGFARASSFGGPQLPMGGFKASGRIGSAMAERLAALQAQASPADDDEPPARAPRDVTSPPPAAQRPALPARAQPEPAASHQPPVAAAAAPPAEWQKRTDDELARLRSDAERARRGEEQVEQLAARLAASEREAQGYKQTAAGLERQVESLTAQLAALAADLAGVQRSVAGLASRGGVSSDEVVAVVRGELKSALDPVSKHRQELQAESARLDKKIDTLRAYVDELVVDEE